MAGSLLALGARGQLQPDMAKARFNAIQIGVGLVTLVALSLLLERYS